MQGLNPDLTSNESAPYVASRYARISDLHVTQLRSPTDHKTLFRNKQVSVQRYCI